MLNNTVVFVIAYLVLMVPTYFLPYFGSNSAIANLTLSAVGHVGPTPQWWFHMWSLSMLLLITYVRASIVNRKNLPLFPALAMAFDLIPGLSMIPLVPTVMHLITIVLGASDSSAQDTVVYKRRVRGASITAAIVTTATVMGCITFATNFGKNVETSVHKFQSTRIEATKPIDIKQSKVNDTKELKSQIPLSTTSADTHTTNEKLMPEKKAIQTTPTKIKTASKTHIKNQDPGKPSASKSKDDDVEVRYITIN